MHDNLTRGLSRICRRLPHAVYDRAFGWVLMLLAVYSAFVSDIRAEEPIKPLPEEVRERQPLASGTRILYYGQPKT